MTRRSRLIVGGVLGIGLVLLAFARSDSTAPLDPDSTEPDGAKALVMLLDEYSGEVNVLGTVPGSEIEVAVLLDDQLSANAAFVLENWVVDGGVLVVADPNSPFVPAIIGSFPVDGPPANGSEGAEPSGIVRGTCMLAGIDGLGGVNDVGRVDIEGALLYDTSDADGSCFGDSGGAFVHYRRKGKGAVISVGGAGAFTNDRLDEADNPVLAVALMVPSPGTAVGVLRRSLRAPRPARSPVVSTPDRERRVGDGSSGLFELMPDYLRWVALDLALGWLIYVLAMARRLGGPVEEKQPVAIAGSELVRARGRLLRRVDPAAAVSHLVDGFRIELAAALGASRTTPDEDLAALAAARCDIDAPTILAALHTGNVRDDGELVGLTRRLDHIRQEVQND